jgi:hypothetical protein
MSRNRVMATVRCVVHLIPISAAVLLVALNASNYWIGGELAGVSGQDAQKLGALAFAAKLHELFMLASLSAIVIMNIRKEVVFGQGIPFGTLFAATQIKDLAFLWSPEFWGTVYHEWGKRRNKWFTITLLVVCTLLGVGVGPSTNILMRPRLDFWPAGGTTFWLNATEALLYPGKMEASAAIAHCAFDTGDLSCPAAGWQVFNEQYFPFWNSVKLNEATPQSLYISGRSSLREFSVHTRNIDSGGVLWSNAFTLASVSPSIVADALFELEKLWVVASNMPGSGRLRYRLDAEYTTDTFQPLVSTRCQGTKYIPGDTINLLFPIYNNVTLTGGPGTAIKSFADFNEWLYIDDTDTTSAIETLLVDGNLPSLYWIDDADYINGTKSSMTVVAVVPKSDAGEAAYYTCSIDSKYVPVASKAVRRLVTYVVPANAKWANSGTLKPEYRQIKLSAQWAEYLNPLVATFNQTNETVFSTLASTAGIWKSTTLANWDWSPILVENILSSLVANGIGRASYNMTMIGDLKDDYVDQILPKNKRLGVGGEAFSISEDEARNAMQLVMKAEIEGYAYSINGKTQVAAMTVLSIYVLVVICHIGYSVWTGWYSNSWGSPSELTALAMNSTPSSRLENTGGGIETIRVFKEKVNIKIKDERAQIMFQDIDDGRMLQQGVAYA